MQLPRFVRAFALASGTLVLLAASVVPAIAQQPVPVPGAVYSGRLIDSTGECSRGSFTLGEEFSLRTSEYGNTIESIAVTGVTLAPLFTEPMGVTVSAGIPVASDGSFNHDFTAYGAQVHFEGRFQSTSVSGAFRVSANGEVCEGTFQAELAPPVRQEKIFAPAISPVDGCGGGSLGITRSADLLSITRISLDGLVAEGQTFSGSATFDEGTVTISPDTGSFDWVYFPGREPGQEIAVSGTFSQGLVYGLLTVSPSTCGAMDFQGGPLPSFDPRLPRVGAGPQAGSAAAPRWAIVLAVAGLLALGVGFAVSGRKKE